MSPAFMIALAAASLLFTAAAQLLQSVFVLRRDIPLRAIWLSALLGSLAVAGYWTSTETPAHPSDAGITRLVEMRAPTGTVQPRASSAEPRVATLNPLKAALRGALQLPEFSASASRTATAVWGALSATVLLVLAWSAWSLRREQRTWSRRKVHGTEVLVSPGFGPAIVGIAAPSIVIPSWVLDLEANAQRAIIAHEDEHRQAGDSRWLTAALGVLVLMPWNVGTWLLWRGLHRAIELDCDARVIARGVTDVEYASVLLNAWQRARAENRWLSAPAFAERSSGLGRRVEHLMRRTPRRWVMRATWGSLAAVCCVSAVFLIPAPQLAQGGAATSRAQSAQAGLMPLLIIDGVRRPELRTGTAVRDLTRQLQAKGERIGLMQSVDSAHAVRLYGNDGTRGALALWTANYLTRGGAVLPDSVVRQGPVAEARRSTAGSAMADRVLAGLLDGITLSPAARAKARTLVVEEQTRQEALSGPYLVVWPQRIALQTARNDKLRALITNPSDRATFDGRAARAMPAPTQSAEGVAREVAMNYFYSIDVPPADLTKALRIITRSLESERDQFVRAPTDVAARKAILAKRDVDVRGALSEASARAAFDKRLAQMSTRDR